MFSDAVEVDVKSRTQAYRYINGLTADGGTNMQAALNLALNGAASRSQRVRQVIFITDGSVGNETTLFDQIRNNLGDTRLFTVGIGSAPNSFFMKEAATAGRGTYTFVDHSSDTKEVISSLFNKISQPVLTNVQITSYGISEVSPQVIPDLYLGEPLAFSVRMDQPIGEISIVGRLGQVEWKKTVKVQAADNEQGIAIDWAKRSIDEWQRSYLHGISRDQAKEKITELGLDYHLVTKYTSLVAVDKTPSRPIDVPVETQAIPNIKPEGLQLMSAKYKAQETRFTFMKQVGSGPLVAMAQTANGYQQTLLAGVLILLVSAFLFILVRRYEGVRV
jgi:Ca-activated chloride channel family protein